MDTNVFVVWLGLPGMEVTGTRKRPITKAEVDDFFETNRRAGAQFVLPYAVIVESGNHISKIASAVDQRRKYAGKLAAVLRQVVDADAPWAPFDDAFNASAGLRLGEIAAGWPPLVEDGLGLADYSILQVALYYKRAGFEVKPMTADGTLASLLHRPPKSRLQPPRR